MNAAMRPPKGYSLSLLCFLLVLALAGCASPGGGANAGPRDDPARHYQLGQSYVQNNRFDEAVEEYRMAADAGCVQAQYALGILYKLGHGVGQDNDQAAEWFRKAAAAGYAPAQYNLGCMYRDGLGVEKDDAQAAGWFRSAAEQGHAASQGMLAEMYATGRGVPKDPGQAELWRRQIMNQGTRQDRNASGYRPEPGRPAPGAPDPSGPQP